MDIESLRYEFVLVGSSLKDLGHYRTIINQQNDDSLLQIKINIFILFLPQRFLKQTILQNRFNFNKYYNLLL
jgi:hypothetical protein